MILAASLNTVHLCVAALPVDVHNRGHECMEYKLQLAAAVVATGCAS
jgi:hypothetical protein